MLANKKIYLVLPILKNVKLKTGSSAIGVQSTELFHLHVACYAYAVSMSDYAFECDIDIHCFGFQWIDSNSAIFT